MSPRLKVSALKKTLAKTWKPTKCIWSMLLYEEKMQSGALAHWCGCGESDLLVALRCFVYVFILLCMCCAATQVSPSLWGYIHIIYIIYIYTYIYILYTSVIYMILSLQPTFVSDRAIPKPWRSCRPGSTSQSSLPDGSAWPSSPCQRTTWAMAVVGKSTEAVKNYGFWTW